MNIAVFSVVYPEAIPFSKDFFHSITNQTHKDFTLYLADDGVPNVEDLTAGLDLKIEIKKMAGSPAAIRRSGIEWTLRQGADVIVFADSDDYFSDNRVEVSASYLSKYDIVINELMIFHAADRQAVPMLADRLDDGQELFLANLKNSNCMGLSNSAIKADSITRFLSHIPDHVIAFDWALFTLCLGRTKKAVFTNSTSTYYRQHASNLASPLLLTERQIFRAVEVKRNHYRFVSEFFEEYVPESIEFEALLAKLHKDRFFMQKYCETVVAQAPASPLWWEAIKTPGELGL